MKNYLSKRLALVEDKSVGETLNSSTRKMGRQMASISFKKALEEDGDTNLYLIPAKIPCSDLRNGNPSWEALFIGDPNLNPYAEERLWGDPRRLSLIGITHTLSTPAPLRIIPKLPHGPLYNWDALICTSVAAQNAIKTIWNHSDEIVYQRGGKPAERPQLPIIPLGVDAYSLLPKCSRKEARRLINIPDDAVVVLWRGRFELHCKAHHGSTFSALAHASAACPTKKWILLMYGTAVMPTIPKALKEAAQELCPDVDVRLLNGHDIELGDLARCASDIALSLVDCLQETFGLAPVEAMAAGLPVVVSNWDGYRDTVVEGRTGYLIDTHSFEPGWNNIENLQSAINENSLNQVSTIISSQIGVNTLQAGMALAKLAESPTLAVAMGALGQQRVREKYDWSAVLSSYNNMLDELKLLRTHALSKSSMPSTSNIKPLPMLADIFSEWPSKVINANTKIIATGDINNLKRFLDLQMIQIYNNELPPKTLIVKTFELLSKAPMSNINQLKQFDNNNFSVVTDRRFLEAIGLLLKHGFAKAC